MIIAITWIDINEEGGCPMLDNVKSVQAIISELGSSKTALLPILLAVQDASPAHYVNEAAINEIANIFPLL